MPPTGLGAWLTAADPGNVDNHGSVADLGASVGLSANSHYDEAFHTFLGSRPAADVKLITSFEGVDKVVIKFKTREPEPELQDMPCDKDVAECNRECEKLYGERPAEMMEPCKLAVASQFGGGACFPATATVQESRRGTIRMADVRVGDELVGKGGSFSRVIAHLHDCPKGVALYLRIKHASGELLVSPQHLVYVRRHLAQLRNKTSASVGSNTGFCRQFGDSPNCAPSAYQWVWLPAQDIRSGDELEDMHGDPVTVQAVSRACLHGIYAPLTSDGLIIVNGILCSCYAPPTEWNVPHAACHVSMLPLRLLDSARTAVERWSKLSETKEPLLTVEAMWLLPLSNDPTIHPWASGLLRSAQLTQVAFQHCRALLPTKEVKAEPVHPADSVES